jgi:hypothetical protein
MYPSAQTLLSTGRIMDISNIGKEREFMKSKLGATCFVIGTLLAPFAVHAADTSTDTDRTHPKIFVKDSVITTKVKAKLAEEKLSSLAWKGCRGVERKSQNPGRGGQSDHHRPRD